MQSENLHEDAETQDERPQVELYDPFARNFVQRKRQDPLMRLYDKKIINDDF